jgi:uncharacterized damage-inducible protein DinB
VKQILPTSGLVAAVVLFMTMLRPASAQSPSIQTEMLKDWSDLGTTMAKIASEMPADKYDFKATPPEQSYGERVLHIAQANVRFLKTVGGTATAPTIDANATTKVAAMKAMADSFDYGTALLKQQTDQTMLQAVTAPFIGSSSRARVYTFLIGHTWDIYGQLAVYLRLNGHVPPASQRP